MPPERTPDFVRLDGRIEKRGASVRVAISPSCSRRSTRRSRPRSPATNAERARCPACSARRPLCRRASSALSPCRASASKEDSDGRPSSCHSLLVRRATALALAVAACVPADEALPLGSAEFTVTGRGSPRTLLDDASTGGRSTRPLSPLVQDDDDREPDELRAVRVPRSWREDERRLRGHGGQRGAGLQRHQARRVSRRRDPARPAGRSNRARRGRDSRDLLALASGRPAHALLEATAVRRRARGQVEEETLHVRLRFDTERSAASFGGCRDAIRGTRIRPGARMPSSSRSRPRPSFAMPFRAMRLPLRRRSSDADRFGDDDGTVTMDELDALPAGRSRAGRAISSRTARRAARSATTSARSSSSRSRSATAASATATSRAPSSRDSLGDGPRPVCGDRRAPGPRAAGRSERAFER